MSSACGATRSFFLFENTCHMHGLHRNHFPNSIRLFRFGFGFFALLPLTSSHSHDAIYFFVFLLALVFSNRFLEAKNILKRNV